MASKVCMKPLAAKVAISPKSPSGWETPLRRGGRSRSWKRPGRGGPQTTAASRPRFTPAPNRKVLPSIQILCSSTASAPATAVAARFSPFFLASPRPHSRSLKLFGMRVRIAIGASYRIDRASSSPHLEMLSIRSVWPD